MIHLNSLHGGLCGSQDDDILLSFSTDPITLQHIRSDMVKANLEIREYKRLLRRNELSEFREHVKGLECRLLGGRVRYWLLSNDFRRLSKIAIKLINIKEELDDLVISTIK